jgi:4a-hydroxytetrahydrobiopterin dehydratase
MKLPDVEVRARLSDLPGWSFADNAIVREFAFAGFADAIAFVTRLAFDAEAADHHPDLNVRYRKVTVSWSTHSEGGVTEKDVAGAGQADAIAARFAPRDPPGRKPHV